MEPAVCSQENGQVFLIAPQLKRGERGAGHCGGLDGLLVEVHDNPVDAWSDGAQSLYPHQFEALMAALKPVLAAVGRELA